MAAAASQGSWTPHESLTQAPTNLKEAIDWVLRVTGKDGKKNAATKPEKPDQFSCLCFLAKAVKDLLYDARSPGTPGPSEERYWDELLLPEECAIVHPVLTDLGLVSTESTSATSTTYTCAGGTEVIRTLIDHLALGLQKWVGWKEGDEDMCCLKGADGIGKGCTCSNVGSAGQCCNSGGSGTTTCHQCVKCGTSADSSSGKKCYQSAYCKKNGARGGSSSSEGDYYWPTISSDPEKVHLLARIFLGSVCLIWSGLSQLGFLTGNDRWKDHELAKIEDPAKAGLGSFMAAMGYDLERLNQGGVPGSVKKGQFVQELLSGKEPSDEKNRIPWKEFTGDSAKKESVAEYYSTIYQKAVEAKNSTTESICKDYPLLVLHVLASGYFRAGSAGAKGIIAAKPSQPAPTTPKTTTDEASKKPRHPRTIREILYWLSALPYSQGYCGLVERMEGKMKGILPKDKQEKPLNEQKLTLESTESDKNTELKKDCITHYLLAACGYCPLVLIGIQGTIATSGNDTASSAAPGSAPAAAEKNRCPQHKKDPNAKRCNLEEIKKRKEEAAKAAGGQGQQQQQQQQQQAVANELKEGQVCYGGYHLEVSKFGPLHGMYANGLYGFDMDVSPAQCLDQLRIYVYHCFYQLYFLRKQCGVGVESGVAGGAKTVLGWKSCRYGKGVNWSASTWSCSPGTPGAGQSKCNCHSSTSSPLMSFLCDGINGLRCGVTVGKTPDSDENPYPEIKDHMEAKEGIAPPHLGKPPMHCPVPMGWQAETTSTTGNQIRENHFKDLNNGSHKQESLTGSNTAGQGTTTHYPAHCTGNTLSLLLEYYCDPVKCQSGTLVVLLRLLACITPTVPRTLGDLFGFYYYIVYIGGEISWDVSRNPVREALKNTLQNVGLGMLSIYNHENLTGAISKWNGDSSGVGGACQHKADEGSLRTLFGCSNGTGQCSQYLSPLSGQQYGQLSPLMAGTYLSWLVYLIEGFKDGLNKLKDEFTKISCTEAECRNGPGGGGCGGDTCKAGSHGTMCSGNTGVCQCTSVVSCTGVLPVLYKYGFGYGDVSKLHPGGGNAGNKQCHDFLGTLESVLKDSEDHPFKKLTNSINQLIYTTRLPWIFVLTVAWLVAVLYLAFGAIWPLDWVHMRSHCRGWFGKGSLSPWEVLMVGKKKGRGILEFFGGR